MDITSTTAGRKKVEKMIKALVTKRLPFVRVKDVKVKPDVDIDGDPILEVNIIHDAPDGRTGDKTYGFRTVLHDALNEMGYPGFPITNFIWHKEYKEIGNCSGRLGTLFLARRNGHRTKIGVIAI